MSSKKAEFTLDKFALAVIVFSFVIVTIVYLVNDAADNYPAYSIDTTQLGSVYDKINESYDLGNDMQGDVLNASVDSGDSLDDTVRGSYKAVRRTSSNVDTVKEILRIAQAEIGIPSYVIKFGIAALLILFVFAIIFLFTGRRVS